MATATAVLASHATLTASTVDTITFAADLEQIEVLNRDGAAEIYFKVGSKPEPPADPTVGGADCYSIPAAIGSAKVSVQASGVTVVKLISSGTPKYSVTAA